MKKIIFSVGMILVVAGIVIGATGAFYADTETSAGNIFVAGSIDLLVDHLRQTYNGVECETCSVNIWSSNSTQVTGGNGAYAGGYPTNAQELSFIHPAWLDEIPGSSAKWIWVTDPVLAADTTNDAEYTFEKKFTWNGSIAGIVLNLGLAVDNGYKIVFNGVEIVDELGTEHNYGALVNTGAAEGIMLGEVLNGENTLEITVRNKAGNSNPASNPAGLIFDLTIQRSEQECAEDTTFQQVCRLWEEKNLEDGDTFFNFGDIKPADWGTNLISLHVDSNDAYACLIIHGDDDKENTLLEPEEEAGDAPNQGNPSEFGELSNYLKIFAWEDDGDGDYESGETPLYEGDIKTEIIAMNLTGGGPTGYVGLAWCAGNINVDHTSGDISCDGGGMLNDAQSDSYEALLTAYAEQQRNNPDFSCADIDLDGGDEVDDA